MKKSLLTAIAIGAFAVSGFSAVLAPGETEVVVAEDAPKTVLFAVEELTNFLAQAFGAPVPVVSAATPGKKAIFLGDSEEARERLTVLQTAADGFAIAEKDLQLRGPGDFFGIRQSGDNVFRIADPIRDAEVLTLAKHTVDSLTKEQYAKAVKLCLADNDTSVVY